MLKKMVHAIVETTIELEERLKHTSIKYTVYSKAVLCIL